MDYFTRLNELSRLGTEIMRPLRGHMTSAIQKGNVYLENRKQQGRLEGLGFKKKNDLLGLFPPSGLGELAIKSY